jgi:hypothetical protein
MQQKAMCVPGFNTSRQIGLIILFMSEASHGEPKKYASAASQGDGID